MNLIDMFKDVQKIIDEFGNFEALPSCMLDYFFDVDDELIE